MSRDGAPARESSALPSPAGADDLPGTRRGHRLEGRLPRHWLIPDQDGHPGRRGRSGTSLNLASPGKRHRKPRACCQHNVHPHPASISCTGSAICPSTYACACHDSTSSCVWPERHTTSVPAEVSRYCTGHRQPRSATMSSCFAGNPEESWRVRWDTIPLRAGWRIVGTVAPSGLLGRRVAIARRAKVRRRVMRGPPPSGARRWHEGNAVRWGLRVAAREFSKSRRMRNSESGRRPALEDLTGRPVSSQYWVTVNCLPIRPEGYHRVP